METATHGNGNGLDDLYVLPQGKHSALYVATVAKFWGLSSTLDYSDVEGQDWHGKHFVNIAFGERLREHFESVNDDDIHMWRVSFTGRKSGAGGITYPQSTKIPATSEKEARELVYVGYEHVTNLKAARR